MCRLQTHLAWTWRLRLSRVTGGCRCAAARWLSFQISWDLLSVHKSVWTPRRNKKHTYKANTTNTTFFLKKILRSKRKKQLKQLASLFYTRMYRVHHWSEVGRGFRVSDSAASWTPPGFIRTSYWGWSPGYRGHRPSPCQPRNLPAVFLWLCPGIDPLSHLVPQLPMIEKHLSSETKHLRHSITTETWHSE